MKTLIHWKPWISMKTHVTHSIYVLFFFFFVSLNENQEQLYSLYTKWITQHLVLINKKVEDLLIVSASIHTHINFVYCARSCNDFLRSYRFQSDQSCLVTDSIHSLSFNASPSSSLQTPSTHFPLLIQHMHFSSISISSTYS